jgi:hypothetical protein
MMRVVILLAAAGCGGRSADGSSAPGPDAAAIPPGSDTGASTTGSDTGSDTGASTPGSDAAPSAVLCGAGTWVLNEESTGPCGPCGGISDFVVLTISPDLASAGGMTADSEGNNWEFDSATCSATLMGTCDTSDVIDFKGGQASCQWTCGGVCPSCKASCNVQPF